ncbi:MAG: type phosphodiesterase/nucleotide pyrophosphatase [Gemmatimonadetes bacterium]|nr:type phosphodiesterase/nucleotide pyrophosphatase [Gemmatimonadota bacterium]
MPVIVLVADGARSDAFDGPLDAFPALARLRAEGDLHRIASVFPSVTGPAYTPFLLGRFPGPIGIPGLRWYDRERVACGWPDYARSYVGHQMRLFDADLDRSAPTVFELVPNSIGALSVVTRGLSRSARVGTLTVRSAARATLTHFRGRAERWLDVDRETSDIVVRRMSEERPDYLFAAFTGVDKASHARGHDDPLVHEALGIVDDAAARLRADAERGGWWDDTHLWIVSDHGHAEVHTHEDLAGIVAATGLRTVAHPWSATVAPDAAVMVSGNAMAHVYLDVERRERPWWPALAPRYETLATALLDRDAVDLMLLPHAPGVCEIRSRDRGSALVERDGDTFRYSRERGDPLGVGADIAVDADGAFDATRDGDYPDAIVQILTLAGSSRAGDMILSARPGWDFRSRYEPIPHRSAHGALHRDHMMVPLLMNRRAARAPRRTTDVFASTLDALGVTAPSAMDGRSFL